MKEKMNNKIHLSRQNTKSSQAITPNVFGISTYLVGGYVRDALLNNPARDFTINGLAFSTKERKKGLVGHTLINPLTGKQAVKDGVIRACSDSTFSDDPIRILKIVRYATDLNFHIDSYTLELAQLEITELMKSKVDIEPQRIALEFNKVMKNLICPANFFRLLSDIGGLSIFFPELEKIKGVSQSEKWHSEGDVWVHSLMVLDAATNVYEIRVAALVHDFGKGETEKSKLPKHYGHEKAGIQVVNKFLLKMNVPAQVRKLALKVTEFHLHYHKLPRMRAGKIIKLLSKLGWHDRSFIMDFSAACLADGIGRIPSKSERINSEKLLLMWDTARKVSASPIIEAGYKGEKVKKLLHQARAESIRHLVKWRLISNLPL